MEDGTYKSLLKSSKSKTGKSLGALSIGRINITTCCAVCLNNAITIAVRYAAVRKQFTDVETNEQIPILEYQSLVRLYNLLIINSHVIIKTLLAIPFVAKSCSNLRLRDIRIVYYERASTILGEHTDG